LTAKAADYQLFNSGTPALSQGGDHLDGLIEMNGPTGTGAGYNTTNFGCDNACHGNDPTHQLPNASGLTVEFGNFGSGSAACDTCHGYPPDGNPDLTGAIRAGQVKPHEILAARDVERVIQKGAASTVHRQELTQLLDALLIPAKAQGVAAFSLSKLVDVGKQAEPVRFCASELFVLW
jgi:hypothetical protein